MVSFSAAVGIARTPATMSVKQPAELMQSVVPHTAGLVPGVAGVGLEPLTVELGGMARMGR